MMKNEMKTNNKTVLLAIVAVFAMIAAGAAVVMASSEDVDAAPIEVTSLSDGQTLAPTVATAYYAESSMTVTVNVATEIALNFYVYSGATLTVIFTKNNEATAAFQTVKEKAAAGSIDSDDLLANSDITASEISEATIAYAAGTTNAKVSGGSVNAVFAMTSAADSVVEIASNNSLYASAPIAGYTKYTAIYSSVGWGTIYFAGDIANEVVLEDEDDSFTTKAGAATISAGLNTVVLDSKFTATDGLAFTYPVVEKENVFTVSGTVTAGEFKVTAGQIKANELKANGNYLDDKHGYVTGATPAEVVWATGTSAIVYAEPSAVAPVINGMYAPLNKTLNVDYAGFIVAEDACLTIPAKYTMNVGAKSDTGAGEAPDYKVTIKGIMDVWGTVKGITGKWTDTTDPAHPSTTYGKLAGIGFLYIRDGAALSGSFSTNLANVAVNNMYEVPALDEYSYIAGTVENDATYVNIALGGKLTILEGKTLTITDFLALGDETLVVNGTLVISGGAVLGGGKSTDGEVTYGTIELGKNGKIVNNGVMAKNVRIVVKSGTSSVDFQAVSGLDFGVSSSKINVSGVVTPVDALVTPGIITNNAVISKALTINSGATLVAIDTKVTGTLVIDGMLVDAAADDLTLDAGAILDINGSFDGAVTLNITTIGGDKAKDESTTATVTLESVLGTGKYAGLTANGYLLSVEKVAYVDEDQNDMYYQHAYICGELALSGTPATGDGNAPHLTLAGEFFVPEALELKQTADATVTGATLIVEGTFTSSVAIDAITCVGGVYSTGTGTSTLYTVAGYEAAIDAVAGANAKTVTINGYANYIVELTENVVILDKEIIDTNDIRSIIVPEGVVLYVSNGGAFDEASLAKIEGKVIVEKEGNCEPNNMLYDVTSTDADDTVTYCGFQTALNEAEAGDTITITKPALALTSLSVPAGVTVVIDGASTVTIEKTIIVADGAAFNVEGRLNFGSTEDNFGDDTKHAKNSKITVTGTMDLSTAKGVVLYPYIPADVEDYDFKYNMSISSTGKFIFKAAIITAAIEDFIDFNGVLYKEGTYTILSTIENALEEGASEIVVSGEYSTTDDVILDGATMTVAPFSKVSFGAVDITDGTLIALGTFSGTVTGTADDDAVAVGLTKFIGVVNDKKVGGTYVMDIAGYGAGSITVLSGEAVLSDDVVELEANTGILVAESGILTIASAVGIEVDDDAVFAVAGTLHVVKDTGALGVLGDVVISGMAIVDGELEIVEALITGSVIVNETGDLAIASAYITGSIAADVASTAELGVAFLGSSDIGAGATILGKVTLMDEGFLMVFPGSEASEATLEGLEYYTTFVINEDLVYGTAYAKDMGVEAIGDILGATPIDHIVKIPGFDMTGMTDAVFWTDVDGMPIDNAIGSDLIMCFGGDEQTANVKVSVATGMSIYVDGVKYASGTNIPAMAMGAHTVSVTVDPGYKYADGTTATITFNGKVLSGLMVFEITSDMVNKTLVLSAIGDIVVDQQDIPEQEKEDNTIIMVLLAVLVVMVVILAIVVILRMMRS